MPRVSFAQPAMAADSDEARSFRTHASYVRAFSELALGDAGSPSERLKSLHNRAVPQLRSGRPQDQDGTAAVECLQRAWSTELILSATVSLAEDSEIVRLTNSWGAVQAYYCVYGATQAVVTARGQHRPTNHEPTHKLFNEIWVASAVDLAPWSFAAADPSAKGASFDGFIGCGDRPIDGGVHPWSSWSGDQKWDVAARALTSTRSKKVDEAFRKQRATKLSTAKSDRNKEDQQRIAAGKKPSRTAVPSRTNLTKAESNAVRRRVRPFTVSDYLYRLRIKANYEDVSTFTDGPANDEHARELAAHLVHFTSANLLVHEVLVADRIGKKALLRCMDQWLTRHSSDLNVCGVNVRRELHAELLP